MLKMGDRNTFQKNIDNPSKIKQMVAKGLLSLREKNTNFTYILQLQDQWRMKSE